MNGEILERKCPECGVIFSTTNTQKTYCSRRCQQNVECKRRYKREMADPTRREKRLKHRKTSLDRWNQKAKDNNLCPRCHADVSEEFKKVCSNCQDKMKAR